MEKKIFFTDLDGTLLNDNKEITELIDKDKKYVENVMFRINRKYKDMLKSGKY